MMRRYNELKRKWGGAGREREIPGGKDLGAGTILGRLGQTALH